IRVDLLGNGRANQFFQSPAKIAADDIAPSMPSVVSDDDVRRPTPEVAEIVEGNGKEIRGVVVRVNYPDPGFDAILLYYPEQELAAGIAGGRQVVDANP